MSASYPKTNPWPYVLCGIVLFGLVLRPPTQLPLSLVTPPALLSLWNGRPNTETVSNTDADPKLIPHEVKSAVDFARGPQRSYRLLSPAPTAQDRKPSPSLASESVSLPTPVDSLSFAAPTSDFAQASQATVWQPPQDWVPTLIEPGMMGPARSAHAAATPKPTPSETPPAGLALVPIADPVAKIEVPRKLPKQPGITKPIPSFSLAPIDSDASSSATEEHPDRDDSSEEAEQSRTPSSEKLAEEDDRPREHGETGDDLKDGDDVKDSLAEPIPSAQGLASLFKEGSERPRLAKWVSQLSRLVDEFWSEPLTGSLEQTEVVERVHRLANYPVAVDPWPESDKTAYWRIRHALQRRVDVWRPLLRVAAAESAQAPEVARQTRVAAVRLIDALRAEDSTAGWSGYLRLPELLQSRDPSKAAEASLLRLRSADLTSQQQAFLSTPEFVAFEEHLRTTISHGTTGDQLRSRLEDYETQGDMHSSMNFVSALQRFSNGRDSSRYTATLDAIDTHYRNANLRVSLSGELIDRFVPAMHQYAEQVHDTILGASVRGSNATWTNLSVQLIPDPRAIRFGLLANGQVQSRTSSRKGPVVFYNQGKSQFSAGKELVLSPQGIYLGRTETRASTGNRVVGMQTDWDEIPFLGWMVRNFARQQHAEQRPFLRAEILRRVRRSATTKMDVTVLERVTHAEQQLKSRLVEPLETLDLDPRVLEMRTTPDRAVLRTRLAGPLQLAAHTPRPLALRDSLFSVQAHQTAANNFMDQLQLNGRSMTLGQLAEKLTERFGIVIPVYERRKDTIVEFAQDRPLEFRFQDGKIQIAIHFARLDNGRDVWKNFSVRGCYRADIREMNLELTRDGSIELITETQRLRDQIALRSIFTKVFDTNHRLDILRRAIRDQPKLRNLEVNQLVIRDGWISASVGESEGSEQNVVRPRSPLAQKLSTGTAHR